MPASPQELKAAIEEFIALVEDPTTLPEDRLQRLRRSLDRLALLEHEFAYAFVDDRDYPDAPR